MKIMKQLLISIVLMTGLIISAIAQPPHKRHHKPTPEQLKKIKQAHIAFVSSRVTVSSEQSEKFWPIYNEFHDKRQDLKMQQRAQRRDLRKYKMGKLSLSEAQIKDKFEKVFELKQKINSLEEHYHKKFLAILSVDQVLDLYGAEKEFLRTLRQRAGHRGKMMDDE